MLPRIGKPTFGVRGALISLGITGLIGAGGAIYGVASKSEATYWSSAFGTASGGMVAVLAAYFFWQADRYYADKKRESDLSHEAAQEIIRLNRHIRQAAWGGVYDKEFGFPEIGEKFKNDLKSFMGQIEAQGVWLSDDDLRHAVDQIRKFLTADTRLEVELPENLRLTVRTFEGTRWLDSLLVKHVKGTDDEVGTLAKWDEFEREFNAFESDRRDWEASYDAWWEEEKQRQIEENRMKSEELRRQKEKDTKAETTDTFDGAV